MQAANVDPLLDKQSSSLGTGSFFPYMQAVVLFNLAVYAFHTYLDYRQLKV